MAQTDKYRRYSIPKYEELPIADRRYGISTQSSSLLSCIPRSHFCILLNRNTKFKVFSYAEVIKCILVGVPILVVITSLAYNKCQQYQ